MSLSQQYKLGITGRVVEEFLVSKLPIIFIIASLLAGAAALVVTPREEEPQIVVPVVDVMISFPGAYISWSACIITPIRSTAHISSTSAFTRQD